MAKKVKQDRTTRQSIHKIWGRLGLQNWQEILNTNKRENGFVPAGDGLLKGLCLNPDHADTTPSCFINVNRGFVKCFGCGMYESDPLRVLALIMKLPPAEIVQRLQTKYNINFLPKRVTAELEAHRINLAVKEEIYQATHQMMCTGIADINNPENAFVKRGVDWLVNERKIPIDTLQLLPIGVMPELAKLQECVLDRYVVKRAAYQQNATDKPEPTDLTQQVFDYLCNSIQGPKYIGGLVIPLHVNPKEIGRIKLREAGAKEFNVVEDAYEDSMGLFGLGWEQYSVFYGTNSPIDYAYVVEGEFDALSVMAQFMVAGKATYPIVSAGGMSTSQNLEYILKTSGIKRAYYIGDTYEAEGETVVQDWLAHTFELPVHIFNGWSKLPNVKDLDEAVVTLGEPAVTDVIYTNVHDNFVSPPQWAYMRADRDMANTNSTEIRTLMEIAAMHGMYIHNRIDAEYYTHHIASDYGLNENILKREIATRENTEDGFILRCSDALSSLMYIVGTDVKGNNRCALAFDKQRKRFNNIKLESTQSAAQELAPIVGTLYDFVQDFVGYPTFLDTGEEGGLNRENITRKLGFYIKEAISKMTAGAPDLATAVTRKQGYHVVPTATGKKEYIVCGSDIFKINRYENDISYQKLEGPTDEGIVFDIGISSTIKAPWYPGGLSVEKLTANRNVDLRQLYEDLCKVYDVAFTFKHQEVTVKLVAALLMVYAIMDAFLHPIIVFMTGDSNSGKSNFVSTIIPHGYQGQQLLFCGQSADEYTPASVATMANHSTLVLCLDEFESSDVSKRENTKKIFEMFRSLVSGEATRERGRPDGSSYQMHFRCPIIYSAIQGAERIQDVNRLIRIETKRVDLKDNPGTIMHREFTDEQFESMQTRLNLGMYLHAPALAALELKMKDSYDELKALVPVKLNWRLSSSFFAVLALMEHIGVDWRAFFRDYVMAHEHEIDQAATMSESETYLNAMMYNATLPQQDRPPASIAQLMISPERRNEINIASCGVYFDANLKMVLFLLDQAVPKLLPTHMKYSGLSGSRMKEILDRHPAALNPNAIKQSGILRKVGSFLGAGIRLHDVTVLHADAWLTSADEYTQHVAEEQKAKEQEDNGKVEEPTEKAATRIAYPED